MVLTAEVVARDRLVGQGRTHNFVEEVRNCKFAEGFVHMAADFGYIVADFVIEVECRVADFDRIVDDCSRNFEETHAAGVELEIAGLAGAEEVVVCFDSLEEVGCKAGGWNKHRDVIGVG